MTEQSFKALMRRLSKAGFKREFVTAALLPDWWEESYAQDSAVLPEVEIRIARFFGTSLSTVRSIQEPLALPSYGDAQLRRVRDVSRDRLAPAIHAAVQVAKAVIRNLKYSPQVEIPPNDALAWRHSLRPEGSGPVQLEGILDDLWVRGIPVIPMEVLPVPSFQGLACIVDGHPVLVLGYKYDEPGRVSFLIAHEIGHIAAGDCSPGIPVVDEDEAVLDDSGIERKADQFAVHLLVGAKGYAIPEEEGMDAKLLAQEAVDLESQTGTDASSLIYAWAARTLDYATASMAVRALYRSTGARLQVRRMFAKYVDSDSATESDRDLLRCVYGKETTAIAG